jgi:tetratricopeptide (TPR) repeat protein
VQGVQTEELLSLRVVCLERRRKDFQALTRLLTEADGKVVERAVDAAHALPSLHECQDIESLANQVALPADPDRRAEIEQLGARLAEVKALQDAGQYKRALEAAQHIEAELDGKRWLPLRAELRSRQGWLQHLLGQTQEGARNIELGIRDAEAARADRTKVEALTRLLFVYGVQGQQERAELWAGLADAALERLGGDPLLASDLQGNLGNVALRQSRYAEARTYFEKTRELQQQVLKPGDPRLAKTVYNLGMTALFLSEAQQAEELLSEALRQTAEAKGQRHPDMALRHAMLSWAQRENGNHAGALEHARAAVSIRQATFGQEHPAVAEALDAVGMSLIGLKQHDEARKTFEAALAMRRKLLGPEHADLVYSYDGLGRALLEQGRAAEALSPLEKALAFKDVEPETQAEVGFNLARALWESGKDRARAKAVARGARERYASLGKQARVKEIDAWMKEVASRRGP